MSLYGRWKHGSLQTFILHTRAWLLHFWRPTYDFCVDVISLETQMRTIWKKSLITLGPLAFSTSTLLYAVNLHVLRIFFQPQLVEQVWHLVLYNNGTAVYYHVHLHSLKPRSCTSTTVNGSDWVVWAMYILWNFYHLAVAIGACFWLLMQTLQLNAD